MNFKYFSCAIVCFITLKLTAQQPFQLAIDPGAGLVYVNAIIPLADSSVIIGGSHPSGLFIAKCSKTGNLIWVHIYPISQIRTLSSLFRINDGGFLIAGSKNTSQNNRLMYMARLDSSRNVLWAKAYGTPYDDEGYSAIQTSDGGFILSGETANATERGIGLVKTDSSGTIQWSAFIENPQLTIFGGMQVIEISDGSFITCGTAVGVSGINGFITKISSSGNQLWTKVYGTEDSDYLEYIAETSNGDLILTGRIDSTGIEPYLLLLKTDPSGNIIWSKIYGNSDYAFPHGVSIQGTDILIFGNKVGINRGFAIKTNSNGDTLFSRTYYGYHQETAFHCAAIGADKNLWFGGSVSQFFGGYVAGLLLYTDSMGVSACNTRHNALDVQNIVLDTSSFSVDSVYSFEYNDTLISIQSALNITDACLLDGIFSVNTIEDYFDVKSMPFEVRIRSNSNHDKIKSVSIIELTGKKIISEKFNSSEASLSTNAIQNGLYFVVINSDRGEYVKKIFLTK